MQEMKLTVATIFRYVRTIWMTSEMATGNQASDNTQVGHLTRTIPGHLTFLDWTFGLQLLQ